METKGFWWLKSSKSDTYLSKSFEKDSALTSSPRLDEELSSSLIDIIEKERNSDKDDADIGSIIEEINRLAAQSPLGPYEKDFGDRSVDDIMKEAERIYIESSKSFEQLSIHSATSQNISDMQTDGNSEASTPTPKSISPLPEDIVKDKKAEKDESDSYSDDFSEDKSEVLITNPNASQQNNSNEVTPEKEFEGTFKNDDNGDKGIIDTLENYKEDVAKKEGIIKMLIDDSRILKGNIETLKSQLETTTKMLEESKTMQTLKSPEIDLKLEKTLEELKDTRELNTALQLQLDALNKTHHLLKISYDDLVESNKNLERRLIDTEALLGKYKSELTNVKEQNARLIVSETNLNRLLEAERTQTRSLKLQTEKDAKCILDLNRQIKEMERIIARKHPDSVSALIVASKSDIAETSPSARRVLEDRIKSLEEDATSRETQSSKIFLDVQEKFNLMKNKYESHIEDLELHVNDLKEQLKRKSDTYDVYTQTFFDVAQKYPEKETKTCSKSCQVALIKTEPKGKAIAPRKPETRGDKGETHLLATIRGLQADLSNKEKVVAKLHRDIEELKKTNRRLQKEREGSLKTLNDKREIHSYPEQLAQHANEELANIDAHLMDELRMVKNERDKIKLQLCRLENDYQQLKTKRLQDLTALQEAHEREISAYLTNITPLREQLEIQQVTIGTLQQQLNQTKEALEILTVEKEHLNNRLKCGANIINLEQALVNGANEDMVSLRKKMAYLEAMHEEREQRLRAIVHGLAQKTITNRSCEQCAARQQQLIGYKAELDQLLATLRSLQ